MEHKGYPAGEIPETLQLCLQVKKLEEEITCAQCHIF